MEAISSPTAQIGNIDRAQMPIRKLCRSPEIGVEGDRLQLWLILEAMKMEITKK